MTSLTLSTALALAVLAPAPATSGPATPADLNATNGATSITLTWTQPPAGARPVSFRVYEGSIVVGRNTTTHATLRNLVFMSRHTYTVTAVDGFGRESAPSAPISRQAIVGGPFACGITAPTGLAATEVTATAVSLSWSNTQPSYDQPGTLVVLVDSVAQPPTPLHSARIGGLAPDSTHTFQVARRDCNGQLHTGAPVTVTTAAGSTPPAAPTGLTVGARGNTSVALSWALQPAAAAYAVFNGGTRVATTAGTAVTVIGLWRETTYQFTVAALDAAGAESAGSAPATTTTLPCDQPVPAPVAMTASPVSGSSVALSWVSTVEATGFGVYRIAPDGTATGPVATVATPSAMVTGLPPATALRFAVRTQTAACGSSAPSRGAAATTRTGPAARPAAPTGLAVMSNVPGGNNTATVALTWTQPAGGDPATAFRLYEGASVLGTGQGTTLTLQLPSGPSHTVSVVAVDPAGNESAGSAPVTFAAMYIPVP
jgi:chitodextrinase